MRGAGPSGRACSCREHLEEDFGPFVATIRKAVDVADRRLLTRVGFTQALAEKAGGGVWQIASAQVAFATGTTSFNPWGAGDVFTPATPTKSPLDIVRGRRAKHVLYQLTSASWLRRSDVTELLGRDEAFQTFAAVSAPALVRSIASEVVGQRAIVFSGPPRLNIALADDGLAQELHVEGYRNLRAAVAWVYEDLFSLSSDTHLFAAEFARSVTRDEPIAKAFYAAGRDILEGSRLAFQLSQSDLSREAIKAQGDLRKAIADDTSKAAEGTRTLSGAIAVAIATGITLIASQIHRRSGALGLSLVAGVVAGYLIVVTVSGWAYLNLQSKLRDQWRRRFYRFVPADDYEAMVTIPARSAERPYYFIAAIALLVSVALGWMAFTIWRTELAPRSTGGVNATDSAGKPAPDFKGLVAPTPTPAVPVPTPDKSEQKH